MCRLLAGLCILVAFGLMAYVTKRFDDPDRASPRSMELQQLLVAAVIGITAGPMIYLNPRTTVADILWPPIPFLDKLLFWVLAMQFAAAGARALLGARPLGEKVTTFGLGVVLASVVCFGVFGSLFGGWAGDVFKAFTEGFTER